MRWISLPRNAIRLTALGVRAQAFERLRELVDEEILGVAVLAPPLVLCFEPTLSLSEQNDLHAAPDTV
jgi:hypothetical protein